MSEPNLTAASIAAPSTPVYAGPIGEPKVLLVYPPITKQERYGSGLGIFGGNQIPLGVFYLASYLREQGIPVWAVDGEARGLTAEDIVAMVEKRGCNVVGLSTTTVAFHRSLELATILKARFPGIVTIIGGPHVSTQPAQPLDFDVFDYAVRNKGEETLHELVTRLAGGAGRRHPGDQLPP